MSLRPPLSTVLRIVNRTPFMVSVTSIHYVDWFNWFKSFFSRVPHTNEYMHPGHYKFVTVHRQNVPLRISCVLLNREADGIIETNDIQFDVTVGCPPASGHKCLHKNVEETQGSTVLLSISCKQYEYVSQDGVVCVLFRLLSNDQRVSITKIKNRTKHLVLSNSTVLDSIQGTETEEDQMTNVG